MYVLMTENVHGIVVYGPFETYADAMENSGEARSNGCGCDKHRILPLVKVQK